MATTHYQCVTCGCMDTVSKFSSTDGSYHCPNCGESDDIFPERLFRCSGCGYTAEQLAFFGPGKPADEDPTEAGWTRKCTRGFCKSETYSQIPIRETMPGNPSKSLHRDPVPKRVLRKTGTRR